LARALAAIVQFAPTSAILKEDGVAHTAHAISHNASTVSAPRHLDSPPTKLRHFGHERKAVEAAVLIECRCDLTESTNLDDPSLANTVGVQMCIHVCHRVRCDTPAAFGT